MNPIPRRIKQRPWAPTESLAYITPREGQFLRAHPDAPNAARLPDVGPLRRVNGIPAYWTGAGGYGGHDDGGEDADAGFGACLLYTSPSPRDLSTSRMPSSA